MRWRRVLQCCCTFAEILILVCIYCWRPLYMEWDSTSETQQWKRKRRRYWVNSAMFQPNNNQVSESLLKIRPFPSVCFPGKCQIWPTIKLLILDFFLKKLCFFVCCFCQRAVLATELSVSDLVIPMHVLLLLFLVSNALISQENELQSSCALKFSGVSFF